MTDHDDRHLLAGAYALGSLSGQEKDDFEAYLESSEEARAEIAALSDTAVQLALATEPVTPSAQLKESLMASIRTTPQLPAVESAPTGEYAPIAKAIETPRPASPAQRKAQIRWFTRPVAILAAAAAAVALFAGGNLFGQVTTNDTAIQAQAASLVELTAASDVQRASSAVAGAGQATLIWSLELRRSAVVIDKLPNLPAGKTYQLWYIDAAGAKPAGTFESSDGGMTWHVLDGKMSGGDTIGVTVEPDGGSPTPTTKPIVAIATA
ncbi:MAG: anti-sigma factor [Lacisediminihabitans sp.]